MKSGTERTQSRNDWEAQPLEILQMIAAMMPQKTVLTAVAACASQLGGTDRPLYCWRRGRRSPLALRSFFLTVIWRNCCRLRSIACPPQTLHPPHSYLDHSVRTVFPGAGEILGVIMTGPCPTVAQRKLEPQFQAPECLTALAIEQTNLLAELHYCLELDSLTGAFVRLYT
jgi:hypothetical protein